MDQNDLRRVHAVIPVTAVQSRHNMIGRDMEKLFPVCEEPDIALAGTSARRIPSSIGPL